MVQLVRYTLTKCRSFRVVSNHIPSFLTDDRSQQCFALGKEIIRRYDFRCSFALCDGCELVDGEHGTRALLSSYPSLAKIYWSLDNEEREIM